MDKRSGLAGDDKSNHGVAGDSRAMEDALLTKSAQKAATADNKIIDDADSAKAEVDSQNDEASADEHKDAAEDEPKIDKKLVQAEDSTEIRGDQGPMDSESVDGQLFKPINADHLGEEPQDKGESSEDAACDPGVSY